MTGLPTYPWGSTYDWRMEAFCASQTPLPSGEDVTRDWNYQQRVELADGV